MSFKGLTMIFTLLLQVTASLHRIQLSRLTFMERQWFEQRKTMRLWIAMTLRASTAIRQHQLMERCRYTTLLGKKVDEFKVQHANETEFISLVDRSLNLSKSGLDEWTKSYFYLKGLVLDHLNWVNVYTIILQNQNRPSIVIETLMSKPEYVAIYKVMTHWWIDDEILAKRKQFILYDFLETNFKEDSEFKSYWTDAVEMIHQLAETTLPTVQESLKSQAATINTIAIKSK